MLIAYLNQNELKPEIITYDNQHLINAAVWIDLVNPTKEEEDWVETCLKINIPTRDEMQEIEISSRLYKEDNALFMTVVMVANSDSLLPQSDAVTLILAHNKLLTLRYIDPKTIKLFVSNILKFPPENHSSIFLFIGLLETSIDRLADILEKVSHSLDYYSKSIFPAKMPKKPGHRNYRILLQKIGSSANLNTKVEQSLLSFHRLILFFQKNMPIDSDINMQSQFTILSNDIKSLLDHVNFISDKVNFLFNATLGMVSVEQNDIIRIFTIAAVILLPPTLIATIYGMNFSVMPELKWYLGYPFSILLMLFSAFIPYKYFKKKKWL